MNYKLRYIGGRVISSFVLVVFLAIFWEYMTSGPYRNVAYLLAFLATPGPELIAVAAQSVFNEL
jgi:hypothetical protein